MSSREPKYASFVLHPRWILLTAAGLAVLMTLALVVVAVILPPIEESHIESERALHPMSGVPGAPGEPLLQADPYRELAAHAEEVERRLRAYGWIERESGVIHVPVERAMELLVQRGLPVREKGEGR